MEDMTEKEIAIREVIEKRVKIIRKIVKKCVSSTKLRLCPDASDQEAQEVPEVWCACKRDAR